jgi:hypothetical protein
MGPEPVSAGQLLAPVAVRVVDLDRPADLDLRRPGDPYRSALLVARSGGRPVASTVVALTGVPCLSGATVGGLFGDPRRPTVAAPPVQRPPPAVSVVVTTCARAASVLETVASILACRPEPLEVVVV